MYLNNLIFNPMKRIIPLFLIMMVLQVSCKKDEENTPAETTVTDVDGNVYQTVIIGTQTWMVENLKTTKYNDNTDIPYVPDNTEWGNLTTPGYCWLNNDESTYKNPYGAMYNWYTVETEKLCPTGWHVPSNDDWTELEIFLQNNGYNYDGTIDTDNDRETNNKIAKSLAADTNWIFSDITGAVGNTDYPEFRNKTGFTALPIGPRNYGNGLPQVIGYGSSWWCSTEYPPDYAWMQFLDYDYSSVSRDNGPKEFGLSVRCVKD